MSRAFRAIRAHSAESRPPSCRRVVLAAVLAAAMAGPAAAGPTPVAGATPDPAHTPADAGSAPTTEATSAPSAQDPATPIATRGVAHIRLSGEVLEAPPDMELFPEPGQETLREWLRRLAAARRDDAIQAVALEINAPALGWAHAHELADAVRRLNDVKPVHAYLVDPDWGALLIGAAAGEASVSPADAVMLYGVSGEMLFFADAMGRLGLQADMLQVGTHKGAAEPYTRSAPSPEFAADYEQLIDDLYEQLLRQTAEYRGIEVARVRAAVDAGPLLPAAARAAGLIDRVETDDEWMAGIEDGLADDPNTVEWHWDYAEAPARDVDLTNPFALLGALLGRTGERIQDNTIAIIHADGTIIRGPGGTGMWGSRYVGDDSLVACFDEVLDDDRIKAVIFRINSPGGSAVASERIYQAVRRCAETKPVIASIADIGASGGYYVALGADTILADPPAIVGSIGVVGGKVAVSGLLDKIGIARFEVARGKNAGLWLTRPWSETERAAVLSLLQGVYHTFTARVRESRGGKIADVEAIAQGRIFAAPRAKARGLIDDIGGLRDAVLLAQSAAGIENAHFLVLPRPRTLADLLGGGAGASRTGAGMVPELLRAVPHLAPLLRHKGVLHLLDLADLLRTERALTIVPAYLQVGR